MASSISLAVGVLQGVAVLNVAGVVTIDGLRWVLQEAARRLAGQQFGAIVSDYRAAVLAVSSEQLAELLSPPDTPAVAAMPAALVVDPSSLELARGYAQAMADRGCVRRVVTCYETGFAWARARALCDGRLASLAPRAGRGPSLADRAT